MIISITHEHDVDGLGAQAIIYRYLTKFRDHDDDEIKLYYAHYSDFVQKIKQLLVGEKLPEYFIITDIGFNDKFKEILPLFKEIPRHSCQICWFDHHLVDDSIKSCIKSLIKIYINDPERCATEIVKDYFLPEDPVAIEISKYARDRDFGEFRFPFSSEIQSIIEFNRGEQNDENKRKLTKLLAEGNFKDEWYDSQLNLLSKWKAEQEKWTVENVRIIELDDFGRIAISVAEMAGGRIIHILEDHLENIKIYVGVDSRHNEVNIYSEYINCRNLARHFNGGGHKNRAGFHSSLILKNNKEFNAEFIKKLKRIIIEQNQNAKSHKSQ